MKYLPIASCVLFAATTGVWLANIISFGFDWMKLLLVILYLMCAVLSGLQAYFRKHGG